MSAIGPYDQTMFGEERWSPRTTLVSSVGRDLGLSIDEEAELLDVPPSVVRDWMSSDGRLGGSNDPAEQQLARAAQVLDRIRAAKPVGWEWYGEKRNTYLRERRAELGRDDKDSVAKVTNLLTSTNNWTPQRQDEAPWNYPPHRSPLRQLWDRSLLFRGAVGLTAAVAIFPLGIWVVTAAIGSAAAGAAGSIALPGAIATDLGAMGLGAIAVGTIKRGWADHIVARDLRRYHRNPAAAFAGGAPVLGVDAPGVTSPTLDAAPDVQVLGRTVANRAVVAPDVVTADAVPTAVVKADPAVPAKAHTLVVLDTPHRRYQSPPRPAAHLDR